MRTLRTVVIAVLALLALPAVYADDARPSEQSIRELLAVMQSHNMVDTMIRQMNDMWASVMKQVMGGRKLNDREQQIASEAHAKIQALYADQLKWENFEPMMIRVYQSSFSQKDIDGMKAFYSTPTGQAVIAKMPLVVQQTMQAMQAHMGDLIPKVRQIQSEMQAQLQAEREAGGASSDSASAPPSATPQQ